MRRKWLDLTYFTISLGSQGPVSSDSLPDVLSGFDPMRSRREALVKSKAPPAHFFSGPVPYTLYVEMRRSA
eukprot:5339982-Pyramimonas_sp.AAC.1